MADHSTYPRRIEFDAIPAGVQSAPVWLHFANYTTSGMYVGDWGINGHFTSQRPRLRELNQVNVNLLKTTPPPSGTSQFIISDGTYVYESSNTKGIRVYTLDSAGALTLVYTRSNVIPLRNMYHDQRFLYAPTIAGCSILKFDPYTNALKLTDQATPTGATVTSISGNGKHIFSIDTNGLNVYRVDHKGKATLTDQFLSSGYFSCWARKDAVFVLNTMTVQLHAFKVDEAGKLTRQSTYSLSTNSSLITGDQDYIYVCSDKNDTLHSFTYDTDTETFDLKDTLSLSTTDTHQIFWDGAFVLVAGSGISTFLLIGVDRSDGSLQLVKTVNDSCNSIWSNGERILTARLTSGMSVYDFNDSRIRFPVHFTPLGYEQLEGEMVLTSPTKGQNDARIELKGSSPASFDPYIRAGSNSRTLISDLRWDRVAFDWFGNYDRTQDVKNHNLAIPTEIKARLYIPTGAILEKPGAVENDSSVIGAAGWRRQ